MYCGANKYIDINEGSTVGGQRPYTRVATAKSAFIQGIEATYRAAQTSAQSDRLALPQGRCTGAAVGMVQRETSNFGVSIEQFVSEEGHLDAQEGMTTL